MQIQAKEGKTEDVKGDIESAVKMAEVLDDAARKEGKSSSEHVKDTRESVEELERLRKVKEQRDKLRIELTGGANP
jgi:hypothetical protein